MDEKIQAALIGAGIGATVGVLTLVIKDVLVPLWQRRNVLADRRHDQSQIVRDAVWQYVAPLRLAVDSLKWRLAEVVGDRPTYLSPDAPRSVYVEYKRVSTLYRIAAMFGWIRALRKERSYLNPTMDTESQKLEGLIRKVEDAFADGQHVELMRLKELLRLWSIDESHRPKIEAEAKIGAELDLCLDDALVKARKERVSDLDHAQQLELCQSAANIISQHLSVSIAAGLVAAERARAIEYFNIREAYIYRDWQAAIGEMMITPISGANRRFDVLGFGEFERRYLDSLSNEKHGDRLWMCRLASVVLDIDLRHANAFDARQEQVRKIYERVKLLGEELETRKGIELQVT